MDLEFLEPEEFILMNPFEKVKIGTYESYSISKLIDLLEPIELDDFSKNRSPLRALILDNDETTGSYMIVFAFIYAISFNMNLKHEYVANIFKRLAFWMFKNNVFRPGIRSLLKKILLLKKYNYLDAVIIYTNQQDSSNSYNYKDYSLEYPDFIKSPAKTIAYMMECLINEKLFDHILTRDPSQEPTSGGVFTKTFDRILQLYPNYPRDITNIVFVDDLASPDFIRANGIDKIHEDSWYCISPYIRNLKQYEIRDCILFCFQDSRDHENIFKRVYNYLNIKRKSPQTFYETNENDFTHLSNFLELKFIFPTDYWIDDTKNNDLNIIDSIVVYGKTNAGRKASETNG
jgi:hypothetical protein